MSEPILPAPIPVSDGPAQRSAGNTGQGAQTALAAMIRKRKMGENHVDDETIELAPRQVPGD